ncbi:HamA C-terminal domain-containing protein [Variovorax ginsengisoli]|uniref:Anti-bacteriophage protein A/HamA C-terminal domain-containing protein n=1 Tax=Variovorax ginsengisoli TaxID=363844 RepID=A0ABT9S409_9BURK|nr:DUF1837 domain-containing protein [Variovorax ginsengisoli]MDP9899080.1 hypothetical protein [Variovorax ginsengisoli]
MKSYDHVPERLLTCLHDSQDGPFSISAYCAGFEVEQWRCDAFADHAMEWIADYALIEEELRVSHTNMYIRLKEAAARVYKSENYNKRGELGEITLHAICRDYFKTIPFAPRVFYLTASNDVVKSFDMVHVRYDENDGVELWLGEAKFYTDPKQAIASAIQSISTHIEAGFLKNEKLLLGPQISKNVPHYEKIRKLLSRQTSLDKLFEAAVFPICIVCDSAAVMGHTAQSKKYLGEVRKEIEALRSTLLASGLSGKIRMTLIYVPIKSKTALALAFDKRLKGLAHG